MTAQMNAEMLQPLDHGPAAVACHRLGKRFGRTPALAGVDLTVPEGAVYVLVGPNGAGKTTLLRVLLDLTRPDAGSAEVFGLDAAARGPEARALVGFLPEGPQFAYGRLAAGELLAHHARYFPAWDSAYAAELVRRLTIPLWVRYRDLSKGLSRRLQLVLALAHRPPLLLLDEPTDGLDPLARDLAAGLLADHLAATPTTVLVSTHRVHEIEGLGDHLGVLREGRLIAQLERENLARSLHRVRADVPAGWDPPAELAAAVVGRGRWAPGDREILWTIWGEEDEVTARLRAGGATVRAVDPLTLEAATLALLAMPEAGGEGTGR